MPARRTVISSHYKKRLASYRAGMKKAKVRACLITNRADHIYLTGFTGEDSAALITASSVWIITDRRFENEAENEAPWARIRFRRGQLTDEVATTARGAGIRQLALQAEHVSTSDRKAFAAALRGAKLSDDAPSVNAFRAIKDAHERKLIDRAIRIAEQAFRATVKTIRIGQTELELAARLEYEMKRRGSQQPAFNTIVAIDANSALPHAQPGKREVRKGCSILFDWGATNQFYRSDLTRKIFVNSIRPAMAPVYDAVLTAQRRAIKAIRPGVRMCDVDGVARKSIAAAGFGDRFTHGLGHGIGLDIHEAPSLSWRSDKPLKSGMVVTVEPGVYLPGVGGVRIEDDVLVTRSGATVLSRLGKTRRTALIKL